MSQEGSAALFEDEHADVPIQAEADVSSPRALVNLRYLGAASLFVSKEEMRYYLNGVYLEIQARSCTFVATDGHRLIAIRQDALLDDADNTLTGGFIVPTPHCKPFKLAKNAPAYAIASGDGTRLTLSYDRVAISFNPIDGTFPDWRRVVPARIDKLTPSHFDYKLLADFKKFSGLLGLSEPSLVPDGVERPALVWFPNHYDALGVIMPLRNHDESGRPAPDWATPAARPDFTPPHDEDGVILDSPGEAA